MPLPEASRSSPPPIAEGGRQQSDHFPDENAFPPKPPSRAADASHVATEAAPPVSRAILTSAEPKSEPPTEQRTIPVNAENLTRIMRLASESMVEARQLQATQQSLTQLREAQRGYLSQLDRIGLAAGSRERIEQALSDLRTLHRRSEAIVQEHARRLERALWQSERTSTALYQQVIGSRMRPFSEGTQAFPRMIRDLAKSLGKRVSFEQTGGSVAVDRDILRKLEAPLNHLLRNCVDHAIETPEERRAAGKSETGRITLEARHHAGMLTIEVGDDGRGIDPDSLRTKVVARRLVDEKMAADLSREELFEFLFLPGFSTARQVTEVSGRGVGLDVVRTL
ncbi:MAG: ATP-binding protein, partial [Planctomycetota bacterium]